MSFKLLQTDCTFKNLNSTNVEDFPLYHNNLEAEKKSLAFADNFDCFRNDKKLVFHCYWREVKPFGRKQAGAIKSIVANHIDILDSVEINLWSDKKFVNNSYYDEISEYVTFNIWNIEEECKGTIIENTHINKSYISDDTCYLDGDIFRLLILHKYGGFYVDMDAFVLKDFSPLNDLEFVYQWGTSGNSGENYGSNGAIMKLDKDSELSLELLEVILNTPASHDTFAWGAGSYGKTKSPLASLPGIWFDPTWGFSISSQDSTASSFKKSDTHHLYEGSFAYHWHGCFDIEPEENSKWVYLEKSFEDKIS